VADAGGRGGGGGRTDDVGDCIWTEVGTRCNDLLMHCCRLGGVGRLSSGAEASGRLDGVIIQHQGSDERA
jgi:hypothetical protein